MVKSLHRSLEVKLASIKGKEDILMLSGWSILGAGAIKIMCSLLSIVKLIILLLPLYLLHKSILDPEYSDSDEDNDDVQLETISAKRISSKGSSSTKRKGRSKKDTTNNKDTDDASTSNEPSTVIYLGHLPVGFEEREITVFLNQFGNVNKCRVSRSTKTGRSRGYAFVDFADVEVAQIVAETMSGYFLLEKRLICHVLPKEKVHEKMFLKPKRIPTKTEKQKKARSEVNQKQRSVEAMASITAKLVKREEMKRKKLVALGIDYEFPGYAASTERTTEEEEVNDGSKKKKRKVSVDAGEDDEAVMKTPKSKKKRKSKKESSVEEDEKENDDEDVQKTEKKSTTKKKKKGKTPKK